MKTWSVLASALSLAVLAGCGTPPDAKTFALRAGTRNVRYDNKGDDKRPGLDRYPTDHYLLTADLEF